jgi:hypothetical protein
MSKYKVKRYDGEEGSEVSAEDEAAMDAAGRFVESGPKTMTMPRRPVSRTPTASSRVSGPGRKPSGPSRADYSNEGKGDSKYRKQTMTPESQALERVYPEQYLAMPGIKGIAAVAKNLANRGATTGAKEVAKRIEPTMEAAKKSAPSVNVRPSAADPKIMEKVSAALKNAPRPVSKPTASQAAFAKGPKGPLGRQSAAERDAILRGDTMDEFGGAMRRGGSVKKMASGGSTGSFRSSANGIAQRGKTRGKMC